MTADIALDLPEEDFSLSWADWGTIAAYKTASYLTDPLCAAHRLIREIQVVDHRFPEAYKLTHIAYKAFYLIGAIFCGTLAIVATPLGIALRYFTSLLQNKPYNYLPGLAKEKVIEGNSLSLLSWNVCAVADGHVYTDGGVAPWPLRMQGLTSKIKEKNADVVCLYEVFDIQTALRFVEGLKDTYSHFYFNIGPNAIGTSSGLFVASKVKVHDPEFTAFPQEALDGRAKYCKKGVFSFDTSFGRFFVTHLQHSEKPDDPTDKEVQAREKEMKLILEKIRQVKNRIVVLTGDLNLDNDEYNKASWNEEFDKGELLSRGNSWGGDRWSVSLTGKQSSRSLNLDHTMVYRGSGATLHTSHVETGFDDTKFNPEALSDHKGLFSVIREPL